MTSSLFLSPPSISEARSLFISSSQNVSLCLRSSLYTSETLCHCLSLAACVSCLCFSLPWTSSQYSAASLSSERHQFARSFALWYIVWQGHKAAAAATTARWKLGISPRCTCIRCWMRYVCDLKIRKAFTCLYISYEDYMDAQKASNTRFLVRVSCIIHLAW